MDSIYEEKYHKVENDMWWFVGRRDILLSMVGKNRDLKVLDVGCAGGVLLKQLIDEGFKKENLFGVDISEKAINKCREKGLSNCFIMDGSDLMFPDNHFDVIIASDSLEHIADDEKALRNWHKLLNWDGKLIIFVPAFKFLWSSHDEVNHHKRRYTKRELIRKTEKAGFFIERAGYWNCILFVPACIFRLFKKLTGSFTSKTNLKDDLNIPPSLLNKIFYFTLLIENKLSRYAKLPFGLSTWVIGRK